MMMPSQPRTFKEYRRIKEEQEKQRKEYENNLRREQEERIKQEEKEKQALTRTEKDPVEEKEELPVLTFDDEDDVMTAKEMKEKRKAKLQKLAESKDPRKRKLLSGKEKVRDKDKEKEKKEDRTAEAMKSFKIPKVRKEPPKPEKLSEIDLFKPNEVKKTSKADLTKSNKRIKLEKFITKPAIEDSSSDGDVSEPVTSSPQGAEVQEKLDTQDDAEGATQSSELVKSVVEQPAPTVPDITPALTDSDSEPGLTIAEEVERRISRESESESETTKPVQNIQDEGEKVALKEPTVASEEVTQAAKEENAATQEMEVVPSCSTIKEELVTGIIKDLAQFNLPIWVTEFD